MLLARAVPPVVLVLAAVLCLPAAGQEVVGELLASDAGVQGGVVMTSRGTQVLGGSEVRAGSATALLRLTRGGDVRVCPGTAVSLTSARDGRGLMLAMSTGSLETRYTLSAASDTILTPDFRITLTGPGHFHFAVSADARGNTCVRALAENNASVIVSELIGSGQYQVKANEEVVFREGGMAQVDSLTPSDCGCPPPLELLLAGVQPRREVAAEPPPPSAPAPPAGGESGVLQALLEVSAPPPALRSGELHVEVDAPFVFRAEEDEAEKEAAEATLPARADYLAATVRLRAGPAPTPQAIARPAPVAPAAPVAAPAKEPKRAEKKGFFRRIGAVFAALVGR